MSGKSSATTRFVVEIGQFGIMAAVIVLAIGVIIWVVHLVGLSAKLDDVLSASMAVSLVAIPVFLVLTGIMVYVFVGVKFDPEARSAEQKEAR